MAVEIKYVVVRKGEEKMTFASKKEADAYDRMLDMAEVFSDWLNAAPLTLDEQQSEALGMYLAENKDAVQHILRTSKLPEEAEVTAVVDVAEENKAAPVPQQAGDPQQVDSAAENVRPKSARTSKAA